MGWVSYDSFEVMMEGNQMLDQLVWIEHEYPRISHHTESIRLNQSASYSIVGIPRLVYRFAIIHFQVNDHFEIFMISIHSLDKRPFWMFRLVQPLDSICHVSGHSSTNRRHTRLHEFNVFSNVRRPGFWRNGEGERSDMESKFLANSSR